ncbi:MAG: hypothetical protein ACJ8GO_07295 [Ramlibacter sp.]
MPTTLKDDLDAIFSAHEKATALIAQQVSDKDSSERAFLERFHLLRESLIKPVFKEVGELVKARGYDYTITVLDERRDASGRPEGPQIEIAFLTDAAGAGGDGLYPRFTVVAEKYAAKLRFRESTTRPGRSGRTGDAGESTLEGLTRDLLEQRLVALLREVFK